MYVMQSKNEFVRNVDVNVNSLMKFGVFVKKVSCRIRAQSC